MRNLIPTSALLVVLAVGSISHAQEGIELAPADPHLAPQEFTVDDGPVSVQVPFQLLVNGKDWHGHTVGWHIDGGATLWLGLPGRGMYVLSLTPRDGYRFEKSGAIRNHVITFQDGSERYEIRTSAPIAGAGKAWNLYVLHLPKHEMKGPLFGIDRLGHCTLGKLLD
jgi:hypothetical protein